ncbi:hypothetical protein [Paludibacterium denitrificans]|uniref:Uncharacterized protein n=1 Tax=Paludibacterium denitrificans TaxID=2675226 RepID=A0A844GG53_9NEIS|nr:hypothetical protein [Paludibacterium denitrificans]MTD33664.1 hypothetical protein [Paludibacterium denitrificans]
MERQDRRHRRTLGTAKVGRKPLAAPPAHKARSDVSRLMHYTHAMHCGFCVALSLDQP